VQEWLNEVSPGTRLEPKIFRDLNESMLTFAFRGELGYSRGYRATNVGFGLSYTLPVIVALLSLPPWRLGDIGESGGPSAPAGVDPHRPADGAVGHR